MDFEPYRRELLAHCYRMLGTPDEAEDVVQETYLRALRAYDRFEGRASLRSWLYRIATNACLTALEQRRRRPLPSGLGAPSADPDAPPIPAEPGDAWPRPIPDALVTPESADPAAIAVARDGVRLALIAGLQLLPPRQRAVLILREVLAFPAAEVAEMLGTSVAAVKSTLQRARARLGSAAEVGEPTEPEQRALLDRYMSAFMNSDLAALEQVLRDDAVIEPVPSRTWFTGKRTCVAFLRHVMGEPGEWRMTPARANGQPAAAVRYRGEPFGVAVLTVAQGGIARITVFGFPDLVARFEPAAAGRE
ncbi:RNA polymerase subunit sigma-70 [Amycolatopsis australiensis]|uniref:RNA polymerase sigma factor n=1 Tax=Amycolatopsis australiensis TaxID=546364 RepID=A0A1K1QUC8_9PSEU|nr:RNA polymerase subunit sigma-70 [Amycolatopsis australiensis]SFW63292.1 RNA polymerase sigma-70 factor, ECF subfamily [Amycolatopsis australiensis]